MATPAGSAATPQRGEPVLTLRGVQAGYGSTTVVRNLDLQARAGEITALIGPNGAGKTTVLDTIAGIQPRIGGYVTVLGGEPSTRRPHLTARRGLAYVPDDRCLFRVLTVRQNLRLAARRGQLPIEPVLQYFPELAPLMDRDAGLLSGGEQQMLVIARALLTRPSLLMIDELSMGLAPIIVSRLLGLIRQLVDDLGLAVLLVEQHVQMALDVADYAYVLNHGDLVAQGAAADLGEQIQQIEASYLGAPSSAPTQ
jgi:branched-chain amino acid transport system ATP-binding protein